MSPHHAKSPAQGHIPALDGIRGFAILMVLGVHFFMSFTPQNALGRFMQSVSGYGTLSIDIFFMLSGLLISGILLDTKSSGRYMRNFLVRRFLRIFPLYYLVLILVLLALLLAPLDPAVDFDKVWQAQAWSWTYLFNFFIAREGAWTVPYIGHFWSLAVEEQFYLIWPLIVFRVSARRLMQICVGLILGATALHFWMEVNAYSKVAIHVLTPIRLNSLCMGAWLAAWLREPSTLALGLGFMRRRAAAVLVLCVLVKLLIVLTVKMFPATHAAFEALRTLSWLGMFAALHLAAVALPSDSALVRFLQLKPLLFLGKYSYGIYLFHHFLSWPSEYYQSVDWLTARLGNQILALLLNGFVGMGLSIGMAWMSYHAFEKHFLRWKDVLAPRQ